MTGFCVESLYSIMQQRVIYVFNHFTGSIIRIMNQPGEASSSLQDKVTHLEKKDVEKQLVVTSLREKLREWELRGTEMDEDRQQMGKRELRLGEQITRLLLEKETLKSEDTESLRKTHSKESSELKAEISKLKLAESAFQTNLEHVKTVQVGGLEFKLKESTDSANSLKDQLTQLQTTYKADQQSKIDELEKVLSEKRDMSLAKVESDATLVVVEQRLQTVVERAVVAEQQASELKNENISIRKSTNQREATLTRECRSLKAALRSAQVMNLQLKKEHQTIKENSLSLSAKLHKLQVDTAAESVDHAKQRNNINKEKQFLEGELSKIKLFVSRLEDGKTDVDIMKQLLPATAEPMSNSDESNPLQRLAAAQRLVADELGLSMTEAYAKWLEIREQLSLSEAENERLRADQQRVVEACELMAPPIYQQQREHQLLLKNYYRLQTLASKTAEELQAANSKVAALETSEAQARSAAVTNEDQIKRLSTTVGQWVNSNDPETTKKLTDRNAVLETEVSHLKQQVFKYADGGEREREIEASARTKILTIKAEYDISIQEVASLQDQLDELRNDRDKLISIIDSSSEDETINDQIRRTNIPISSPTTATPKLSEFTAASIADEAAVQRARQVSDLKAQVSSLENRLQSALSESDSVKSLHSETENALQREKAFITEMKKDLTAQLEASKSQEQMDESQKQQLIEYHSDISLVKEKLRHECDKVNTLETEIAIRDKEIEVQNKTNSRLQKLYDSAVEDSNRIELLSSRIVAVSEGVQQSHGNQLCDTQNQLESLKKRNSELEQILREERDDNIETESRLKSRLKDSRVSQFTVDEENRQKDIDVASLKAKLESREYSLNSAELKRDFLEKQLRNFLVRGQPTSELTRDFSNQSIVDLKAEVETLRSERTDLQSKVDTQTTDSRALTAERTRLLAVNEELTVHIKELESAKQLARDSAREDTKLLQQKLQQVCKYVFYIPHHWRETLRMSVPTVLHIVGFLLSYRYKHNTNTP